MRRNDLASTAPASGRCTKQLASTGGHIQRIEIGTTEAAFVGQVRRERMAFDQRSVRSKDMHQRPRSAALPSANGDNRAFSVQAHALDAAMMPAMVRAEGVQHDWMIERAVTLNGVRTQL